MSREELNNMSMEEIERKLEEAIQNSHMNFLEQISSHSSNVDNSSHKELVKNC